MVGLAQPGHRSQTLLTSAAPSLHNLQAMLSYLHASTTSSAWVHPALAEDFSRGLGLIDELQQMQHEDPVPEEYEEDVDMGYNLSSYGRAASYASPNHSRWGRTGGNGRNNNEVTEALLDAQHSLALLTVHHSNACMRQLRQQEVGKQSACMLLGAMHMNALISAITMPA